LGDYLLCDEWSQAASTGIADMRIGDVPSPIITIASAVGWVVVVKPLAAESAPATMRLANNPRNVFFMIEISLLRIVACAGEELNQAGSLRGIGYPALIPKRPIGHPWTGIAEVKGLIYRQAAE
jgi:hypothetical protein